jgi:biotin operon repressor
MTLNPLLQTLRLVETLSRFDASAETLGRQLDASPATVKRYLVEARALGADICSVRMNGGWVYELRNADAVMARVRQWIDLEEKRDLTQ